MRPALTVAIILALAIARREPPPGDCRGAGNPKRFPRRKPVLSNDMYRPNLEKVVGGHVFPFWEKSIAVRFRRPSLVNSAN
jgi:hypothetical protein